MELQEVYTYLKDIQYVNIATIDDNRPRVRTMALVQFDHKFWLVTFTGTAKLAQIISNHNIEMSCDIYEKESAGSIRGQGIASICEDQNLKEKIIPAIWFFDRYFKSPTDPNYQLIQLSLSQFEVQSPKNKKMYLFNLEGD
ncbi:hypothetical protein NEF87_000052 [Candidatus Lokiarchaeum ossiferum]|uniref:Pyridoxamine 5'-phosphate oxidase N-terminal domain-containing protein n=1 Tax=Candidatus Lokiarchaeum ossiferum TaxID=2951803 RepID=A0ABY6HLK2_9ARCH|nr:hypothetical protein NEF87_000052 [Candidatus Lokiarchaeum sp. B-35]